MLNTRCSTKELAMDLCLNRAKCRISVAAVLSDSHGIFAWGWNNPGEDGSGEHAEEHAFKRANKKRLNGATLTVAGVRRRDGKIVKMMYMRPCEKRCLPLTQKHGIKKIEYTTKEGGVWETIKL